MIVFFPVNKQTSIDEIPSPNITKTRTNITQQTTNPMFIVEHVSFSSSLSNQNPIIFLKSGSSDDEEEEEEGEESVNGVPSPKCCSTISWTDLADSGWKLTPQFATNPLTKTHFSSLPIFVHFVFRSSGLKSRYWLKPWNNSSLLFFMASSLCINWVLIFPTSDAKPDASSASLKLLVQQMMWVLAWVLEWVMEAREWDWISGNCERALGRTRLKLRAIWDID